MKPLSERVRNDEFERFDDQGIYALWSTLADEIAVLEAETERLRNGLHAIKCARSKGEAHRIALQALGKEKAE